MSTLKAMIEMGKRQEDLIAKLEAQLAHAKYLHAVMVESCRAVIRGEATMSLKGDEVVFSQQKKSK